MGEVDHRPDLRLAAGVGTVTLVATVGPAVWGWAVRDRLPEEVARHWGAGGAVTGTWSMTAQLVTLGAITLGLAAVLGGVAVVSRQPVSVRRSLAACAVWLACTLGASQVDALRGQLDLADPFRAPSPDAGIAIGALGGLLVALGVAALATEPPHRRRSTGPPPASLPRAAADAPRELVQTAGLSRGLLTVVVVTAVLMVIPATAGLWGIAVVGLTVLVPVAVLSRFTTRIDGTGLTVRAAGLALLHVPVEQIIAVRPIDHVDALWEFGGWGLRVDVHGRTGVVSRSGPAVEVERADGSKVVVTLPEAELAAGVLNAAADRHHAA